MNGVVLMHGRLLPLSSGERVRRLLWRAWWWWHNCFSSPLQLLNAGLLNEVLLICMRSCVCKAVIPPDELTTPLRRSFEKKEDLHHDETKHAHNPKAQARTMSPCRRSAHASAITAHARISPEATARQRTTTHACWK